MAMGNLFENHLRALFLSSLLFFLLSSGVEGSSYGHGKSRRLFVFGDSYADTGNIDKALGGAWKVPYGITFPGHPSGRFSDGRVLTDFIAMFLGLYPPIPYTSRRFWIKTRENKNKVQVSEQCRGRRKNSGQFWLWRLAPMKAIRDGVNFAFGGTGVFNTTATIKAGLPNMTSQIDLFQQMLSGNDIVRIDTNLADSIAFVFVVGNDYATFLSNGGTNQELPAFIAKVVNQLALDLQRILGLGFRRILVTRLQPLGCSPKVTVIDSFKQCNSTSNSGVQLHNALLQKSVANLNNHTSESPIHILDLYDSFFTAFQAKDAYSGGLRFENPLKPCCFGITADSSCGDVDENGNKLYTLCDDRRSAFFWDSNHPTQAGWEGVYSTLETTLQQALY